jgi:hypothetical protein
LIDPAIDAHHGGIVKRTGEAVADVREGADSFVTDPMAAFAAAED